MNTQFSVRPQQYNYGTTQVDFSSIINMIVPIMGMMMVMGMMTPMMKSMSKSMG